MHEYDLSDSATKKHTEQHIAHNVLHLFMIFFLWFYSEIGFSCSNTPRNCTIVFSGFFFVCTSLISSCTWTSNHPPPLQLSTSKNSLCEVYPPDKVSPSQSKKKRKASTKRLYHLDFCHMRGKNRLHNK